MALDPERWSVGATLTGCRLGAWWSLRRGGTGGTALGFAEPCPLCEEPGYHHDK